MDVTIYFGYKNIRITCRDISEEDKKYLFDKYCPVDFPCTVEKDGD